VGFHARRHEGSVPAHAGPRPVRCRP
jgi:hypothetical protein